MNTDAVPHTITGGDLLGGGEFDVVSEADDTCTDATLQPGGSCHVNITFNAPTPGAATGVLAMDSDAGNSPHVTTLARGGALPVPSARPDPQDLRGIPGDARWARRAWSACSSRTTRVSYPCTVWAAFPGGPRC